MVESARWPDTIRTDCTVDQHQGKKHQSWLYQKWNYAFWKSSQLWRDTSFLRENFLWRGRDGSGWPMSRTIGSPNGNIFVLGLYQRANCNQSSINISLHRWSYTISFLRWNWKFEERRRAKFLLEGSLCHFAVLSGSVARSLSRFLIRLFPGMMNELLFFWKLLY